MSKLLAFHSDQKIKDKYIKRVKAHAKSDVIVKGKYWENGKGCAVGCTIHGSDHTKYETELGISIQIAYLEDRFFEEIPNNLAMEFPLRFLESITPGADLSLVPAKLMIWQFENEKYGIKHIKEIQEEAELLKLCEDVVSAYKRKIVGEEVSLSEWEDLEKRARAGAGAGAAGAWAAGAGAWAGAGAAGAGAWAAGAAGAGAWAAGAGAWAGADFDKAYEEAITATADKFIELLKEAK